MAPNRLSLPVLMIVLVSVLAAGSSSRVAGVADPATAADSPTARAAGSITLTSHGTS
jgi:hypothetical protein